MHHINRGAPPPLLRSLAEIDRHREWDSSGEKETHAAIKEGLRHSQHRMCAYCEALVSKAGRVEHVHPKTRSTCVAGPSPENWHYQWENLLLVCGSNDHCDGAKADVDLCDHALFPDGMLPGEQYLKVDLSDGALVVSTTLSEGVREKLLRSIEELGLNDPILVAKRKVALEILLQEMQESGDEAIARHRVASNLGFKTTVDSYFS